MIFFLAGGVFVFLVAAVFWQRQLANTLIKYVPDDALFYAYFSLPKAKQSAYLERLAASGLVSVLGEKAIDWPSLFLNREMVLVARADSNRPAWAVMMKTDYPRDLENFLTERDLGHFWLDRRRVLISQTVASFVGQSSSGDFQKRMKERFAAFGSVNLYLNRRFAEIFPAHPFVVSWADNIFDPAGVAFLTGRVRKDGSVVFFRRANQDRPVSGSEAFPNNALTVSLSAPADFWRRVRQQPAFVDNVFLTSLSATLNLNDLLGATNLLRLDLSVGAGRRGGWFFRDRDFYLRAQFKEPIGKNDLSGWQNVFQTLMAMEFSAVRDRYLSDGTKIQEIYADRKSFNFLDQNGLMVLTAPDQSVSFWFLVDGHELFISNDSDFFKQRLGFFQSSGNYFYLQSSNFPLFFAFDFLKETTEFTVGDDFFIAR